MWSLSEVNAFRRFFGQAPYVYFPGNYYWPTYWEPRGGSPYTPAGSFSFTPYGPGYSTDPDIPCVANNSGNAVTDIELFCKTEVFLCIDAATGNSCPDFFNYKIGISWEQSVDGGASWTTLKDPKVNFSSNQITIGQVNWPSNGADGLDPDGQFYGIIDSVRLSVGTPRYVGDVIQPYARSGITYYEGFMASHFDGRQYPVADVIDQYVTFALNLFDFKHIKYADPASAVLPIGSERLTEQAVPAETRVWEHSYTNFQADATQFRLEHDFYSYYGLPLIRYRAGDNYFYASPVPDIELPAYDSENTVNTGFSDPVTFTKSDYGSEVDVIIPGELELTRGEQHALYNAAYQTGYTVSSSVAPQNPTNTEWAVGWDDECNVESKTFTNLSELFDDTSVYPQRGLGANITQHDVVLRHVPTNRYWFIRFTSWSQGSGSGGGFAYTRREFYGCASSGTGAVPVAENDAFFSDTLLPALAGQFVTGKASNNFFISSYEEITVLMIAQPPAEGVATYDFAWDFSFAMVPPHVTWFTGSPAQWRTHMTPGSPAFPIYVKGRGFNGGYLFEGDPVHPAMSYSELSPNGLSDVLAPNFRRVERIDVEGEDDIVNNRQILALSNKSAGLFSTWPGVQFPQHEDFNGQINAKEVRYGIRIADTDFTPPATAEFSHITKIMTVDAASTKHIGRLAGNQASVDGIQVADGMFVLVKDQDDPRQNGIYEVRGLSAGQSLDWRRLRLADTVEEDPLFDLYVRVEAAGKVNGGTNWYYSLSGARPPEFGVDEITFVQDPVLGVYKNDFCFESWVKPAAFLHPSASGGSANDGVRRDGKRQTLVDTYMRDTQRDSVAPKSGFRIYFRPEDGDDQVGRVCADLFYYHSDLNVEFTGLMFFDEEWSGPCMVSDVIQANRFHHIALVRDGNLFSLYVNGVRQDQIFTQDKEWNPGQRTTEGNNDLFRGKAFYSRYVKSSRALRLIVKLAEFTYKGDDSPEYAVNFNGAAGMIERDADRLLNLPETWFYTPASMSASGVCSGFTTDISRTGAQPQPLTELATWPGFPIPNYPYRHHVYIVNDITYSEDTGQAPYSFLFTPTLNFPIKTLQADRASTPISAQDVYQRPLKHAGNIDLTAENPPNIPPTPLYGRTFTFQNDDGQTITETLHVDGMPVEVGERILLKDQDNQAENGVWIVSDEAWVRIAGLDDADDLREQLRVHVYGGFTNSGTGWLMSIDDTIKSIDYQINVTPLEFTKDDTVTSSQEQFECYVDRSICRGQGVEVSDEPVVLVDEVAIAHVSLSGFPPASALYSGAALTNGQHRILLLAQNNPAQNGVWNMNAGTWVRVEDLLYSNDYIQRRAEAEENSILFSPPQGDEQGCTYGFRATLEHGEAFVLDESGINAVSLIPEVLNKLHLPTTWLNLTIPSLQLDPDTGLPLIGSGTNVEWDDFIPTTDDKSVWRIRLKCADTENYSRNVIVRMASNLGITLADIYDQQVLPGDF